MAIATARKVKTLRELQSKYAAEFAANARRLVIESAPGTRPVDVKIMKQVFNELLANRGFVQDLTNYALRQGELKIPTGR